MLLILFGTPGVGKSFVGEILAKYYHFYFYDADIDLIPDMKKAIDEGAIFTNDMRDKFFTIVTNKLTSLKAQHKHVVMAQALAKERNRLELLQQHPGAKFILIKAEDHIIKKRLNSRADWVSIEYAQKVKNIFEAPRLEHFVFNNDEDESHIKTQLAAFFDG